MFKDLIYAQFPGCTVITMDQKNLSKDLYDEESLKFLRDIKSIEFMSVKDVISTKLFNEQIKDLQVVIVGNGMCKKMEKFVIRIYVLTLLYLEKKKFLEYFKQSMVFIT